jgi:phosphoenolpyruvate carboxylase
MSDNPEETARTGISLPLSENVNLLGDLLGRVIRDRAGQAMLDRVEQLRLLCKEAAARTDDGPRQRAAEIIAGLTNAEIGWLLRAYGTFFHLVNQAEKAEILRINRERSRPSADPAEAHARPESIDEAIGRLKEEGRSLDQVLDVLGRLDIQPTLTAHPTEARRQSVLHKQRRLAELLTVLRRPDATAAEMDDAVSALHAQIALLLGTDEIRSERPTVDDEVEHGLYFVNNAIRETAPRIHRDVVRALEKHFGTTVDAPVFLRWRSWIGSDQDGNPNVTPPVLRRTLDRQRELALRLQRSELVALHRELSLSDRLVEVPDRLLDALRSAGVAGGGAGPDATGGPGGAADWTVDDIRERQEPYRGLLRRMIERLDMMLEGTADTVGYDGEALVADLDLIRSCLIESGLPEIADSGPLHSARVQARTFGFHLATLDVRQHSSVHEAALTDLLHAARVTNDYSALTETEKLELLEAELRNPRPLGLPGVEPGDAARSMLETFSTIRDALDRDGNAIGSYIISMTHTVSDLLEPMLLAREAGLWRFRDGRVESRLDFVPLFETIDDLRAARERLHAAFAQPIYALQLESRGRFQEVMLGYSDSNKDGGYWMANWALHCAQADIGSACREAGVDFRLFHGRGGTVGRGGGRANQAIGAMPRAAQNGRIRVTEQGEVISFRYALPGIAHRHTEQLVSAMLLSTRPDGGPGADDRAPDPAAVELMDRTARIAMEAYRGLIDRPDIRAWYVRATPIEPIAGLPIASRPVSRGSGDGIEFDMLRAIPWVFAWTQTRAIVPGWYGVGAALTAVLAEDDMAARLRALHERWPFLRAVLANAQREMARARLAIARDYARLAGDDGAEGGVFAAIESDFRKAAKAILRITGQAGLLDDQPVIRKSIALRNPYTDVLNLLQIELLRRCRAEPVEREELTRLLFLSINGIAAAMQSTG